MYWCSFVIYFFSLKLSRLKQYYFYLSTQTKIRWWYTLCGVCKERLRNEYPCSLYVGVLRATIGKYFYIDWQILPSRWQTCSALKPAFIAHITSCTACPSARLRIYYGNQCDAISQEVDSAFVENLCFFGLWVYDIRNFTLRIELFVIIQPIYIYIYITTEYRRIGNFRHAIKLLSKCVPVSSRCFRLPKSSW